MSDDIKAPERIWVDDERDFGGGVWVYEGQQPYEDPYIHEYVRADRIEALEAENARLREALRAISNMGQSSVHDHFYFRHKTRLIARAALHPEPSEQAT